MIDGVAPTPPGSRRGGGLEGDEPALDVAVASRPERRLVLGIPVYTGSLEGAAALVVQRALAGEGGYACLSGAHGITLARRDPAMREALLGAWVNFPDGAPAAWRQKVGGAFHARRVPGPDLMPRVLELGQGVGLRHFLFGSTPEVLERLHVALQRRFPEARLVGRLSPDFGPLAPSEREDVLDEIRTARPHLVWVGLGTPKQDLWMLRNAAALAPALCMGVGAAFDFLSGNKPRAPHWMRSSGLEWLHRMGSEPTRLAPRYLDTNSRFLAYNLVELLGRARRRRNGTP